MPTTEIKESIETLNELEMPGSIITIEKSNRIHLCKDCGASIIKGEPHYCEYFSRTPLSLKHPFRFHIGCLGGF